MSNREQRDNSGVLFVNDRKTKDNHPDSKGSAMINGVEYWVSAWRKESKGTKFLSLAFTEKDVATEQPAPANHDDTEDDVPF